MALNLKSILAPASGSAPLPSAKLAWRAAEHRAALAMVELAEVRSQGVRLSIAAIAGLLGAQLTGISLLMLVAILSWETEYRVIAPAIASGLVAAGTVAVIGWWRAQMRAWRPFESIRQQLAKDRDIFKAMMMDREDGDEDDEEDRQ